jgi:hypothetical protein
VTAYEAAREAIRLHREKCPRASIGGAARCCNEGARLETVALRIHRESLSQGGLFQGPLFDGTRSE